MKTPSRNRAPARARARERAPKPYGYRVTYARQCNGSGETERAAFGCKTSPSRARRNAMSKAGFLRVLALEPLTKKQFLIAFPPGRSQRGRQVHLRNQTNLTNQQ